MKRLILAGLIALFIGNIADAALTKNFYTSTSVLSSGKWVKVGVDQTGVYEITYETLAAMGFSDPARVSVFGRGGRQLPESFTTTAGSVVLDDDLKQVKVLNDPQTRKLFFYGVGPEEIVFTADSNFPMGGYFSRKSNNIYSTRGYYFITDSRTPSALQEKKLSATEEVTAGVSYLYHELDSVQNTSRTGQLFWGEDLRMPADSKKSWNVEMPDAISGPGAMECVMYFEATDYDWINGSVPKVNYGFEEGGYMSADYKENTSLFYEPLEPTLGEIQIPGNKGKVFVEFGNAKDRGDYGNLDFWVVSYERAIPTMKGVSGEALAQQLLALPAIPSGESAQISLPNPASLSVLDVTNTGDLQLMKLTQTGATGTTVVKNSGKTPIVIVFDRERPQLQISSYEVQYQEIENQNLHGYKDQGADFVIITTPRFKEYAEEIAALHTQYDGMKVIVATTEQCYNEFSQGTPDPMAYRSFAKMLYFSDRQPKNMLLLGPLYADFRGIQNEHDPMEGIIAFQSPEVSISRGAHNINDFYGMMSDKFRTDYYERNDVQIGVGILPVRFESEARIVVDKIKQYLQRTDHAYYLNRMLGSGGHGDAHAHAIQVRDLGNHIGKITKSGVIFSPLDVDTYGYDDARKKFLNMFEEGSNMFSYFGHGAEQFLDGSRSFFGAGDVNNLRNKTLTFAVFGGCQITNTDRGFRGLGESLVTATPYGAIGTIISARDTWSGQNYEFFKQFFTCLYRDGASTTSPQRSKPATIGEIYALTKNYSTYNNELAYQLLCDPAIIIPTINRDITVVPAGNGAAELKPGDKLKLTGQIKYPDGTADNSFNGQLVVRLNEPLRSMAAGNIISKEPTNGLTFDYFDEQVAMTVAEVKNGKFEVEVMVPASMNSFASSSNNLGLLFFSAYDPSTKVGAAQSYGLPIVASSQQNAQNADKTAPVIEVLEFDGIDCAVHFTVSDNLALDYTTNPLSKSLYLYIDGKERSEAHFVMPSIDANRPAFSKSVVIGGLSYGNHNARLKVKDMAGNTTEKEIVFTYQPPKVKYSIVKDYENSDADVTYIKVDGLAPSKATLVVMSSEGTEIFRQDFEGSTASWRHEGVAPGHYKAYIIERGQGSMKGHSEPIDVPVI